MSDTAVRQSCRDCGVVDGRDFVGGVITSQQPLSDEQIARLAAALRERTAVILPAGARYEPAAILAIYWVEPDLCAFCATARGQRLSTAA